MYHLYSEMATLATRDGANARKVFFCWSLESQRRGLGYFGAKKATSGDGRAVADLERHERRNGAGALGFFVY
ncbi:hypothetical protein ES332_A06G069100v1 [Gossypium tomentosum]|uniref:Uncharacterized protein n=1 Tax=Gossypium tomentosum TaxID=34277 RepID=A0A5D2Q3A5_GOSTO|nr:hypothetical protein ES332_A06G069100v1 [Gossypium tomentosum]